MGRVSVTLHLAFCSSTKSSRSSTASFPGRIVARPAQLSRSSTASFLGRIVARLAEQCVDERGRFERRQIVGAFAKSDQLHRNTELLLDAEHDAALRRAVELGERDAGDV